MVRKAGSAGRAFRGPAAGSERLTTQVAECLAARLRALSVGAVLEAEHSCMTLRGVRAQGAKTVTSALPGTLRADPRSRAEFFAPAGVPH
jgi:GTP cyclohydrolase I